MLTSIAPVAIGSLYIGEYFLPEDKKIAQVIMDNVIDAYKRVIVDLEWVDEQGKQEILNYTDSLKKYVGYHDNLKREGEMFYANLKEYPEDQFFNIGISLQIFSADRKFKLGGGFDWTKYSQPHTVNALFSQADSSVRELTETCLMNR